MKFSIVARLAGAIYIVINPGRYSHVGPNLNKLLRWARSQALKRRLEICVVVEDETVPRCFYVQCDGTITRSIERPHGGLWLTDTGIDLW